MSIKQMRFLLFVVLFGTLASLSLNYTQRFEFGFYRFSMYADRAAYYSYLPYLFEANASLNNLLQGIDTNTIGVPFKVDVNNDRMVNKYPVGVAMLQAPFYFIGLVAEQILEKPAKNYFNGLRIRFIEVSASFYVSLGLILLYLFLGDFGISVFGRLGSIVAIFLGSSIYYYTVMEGTMSHAYSFFLFSAFNLVFYRTMNQKTFGIGQLLLLGLISGGAVLIRPFNMLLLLMNGLFLMNLSKPGFKTSLATSIRALPVIGSITMVMLLPQFLYYKHAFGWYFVDSYGKESFHFDNPQIIKSLFNPRAGMLIYTPIFLVLVVSIIIKALHDARFWMLLIFFMLMFYINSCWWSWNFGCSFGLRPYVEWLPILILPYAFIMDTRKHRNWLIPLLLVIGYYNIEMSYKWLGCWFDKPETLEFFIGRYWS